MCNWEKSHNYKKLSRNCEKQFHLYEIHNYEKQSHNCEKVIYESYNYDGTM